jgi:hypothetical protein
MARDETLTTGQKVRYLTTAETAKLVRQKLKATFPGQKFSVRSDNYAGGSAIRIRWTDGPRETDVRSAMHTYEGATFDGMIDLKSYKDPVLVTFAGDDMPTLVSMGADWVMETRDLSDEYIAMLTDKVNAGLARTTEYGAYTVDTLPWTGGVSYFVTPSGKSVNAYDGPTLIRRASAFFAPDGTEYEGAPYA